MDTVGHTEQVITSDNRYEERRQQQLPVTVHNKYNQTLEFVNECLANKHFVDDMTSEAIYVLTNFNIAWIHELTIFWTTESVSVFVKGLFNCKSYDKLLTYYM